MSNYLKGNYELHVPDNTEEGQPETTEQEFYRRALEKLGGSIAFVLKPKNLVWKGKKDESGD